MFSPSPAAIAARLPPSPSCGEDSPALRHPGHHVVDVGNRRVRELHDSNRVEGLGPRHLSATKAILESKDASDIQDAINRYTVIKALDTDQRTLDLRGFAPSSITEALVLCDEDHYAVNTLADPQRVSLRALKAAVLDGGRLAVTPPPVSWAAVALR
ncbi:hypothetical protein [Actinoplanes sp. GCM10030250]|uniref:hypothetical protein n=1 Tax=Actinoplanes sp. GCM10030250 TaxID=3273376 RepID=UPI003614439A